MSAPREVRFIGSDGFILTIGTLPDDGLLRVETTVGTLTHVHLIDAIEFVTGEPAPAREEPREECTPCESWRDALLGLARQAAKIEGHAGRGAVADTAYDACVHAGEAAEQARALRFELERLAGTESGS